MDLQQQVRDNVNKSDVKPAMFYNKVEIQRDTQKRTNYQDVHTGIIYTIPKFVTRHVMLSNHQSRSFSTQVTTITG